MTLSKETKEFISETLILIIGLVSINVVVYVMEDKQLSGTENIILAYLIIISNKLSDLKNKDKDKDI